MLLVELNLKFSKHCRLSPVWLPQFTTFDMVTLLQSIFPAYINGCRALGGFLHRDLMADNFALSVELLKSNRARGCSLVRLILL